MPRNQKILRKLFLIFEKLKSERTYEIKVKINGEIRDGLFIDQREGGTFFFEARDVCLSRNMTLPKQGFEILMTPDIEHLEIEKNNMFWIDAFYSLELGVNTTATGEDEKIITTLLEEFIGANDHLGNIWEDHIF